MENLVVIKKQVASIEWNKEKALQEAKDIMSKYEGLEFTEEQLPLAKKELANLRKVSKEINSQALAIDKELTEPVKTFRNEVKEVKSIVDDGINFIDEQVKMFEQKQKDERKAHIMKLESYKNISEFVSFQEDWLKKAWTDGKLEDEFKSLSNQIDSAIKTIKLTATNNGLESEFYIDKFKLMSLDQVIERIIEDASRLKVTPEPIEPQVEIDLEEQVYTLVRNIKGTKSQFKALKKYADSIGVEIYG